MEDFEKYTIEVDTLNPGDFEVMKARWFDKKKVSEKEKEEVFLFFLEALMEKNPEIKEKLYNKLYKKEEVKEENQVSAKEQPETNQL